MERDTYMRRNESIAIASLPIFISYGRHLSYITTTTAHTDYNYMAEHLLLNETAYRSTDSDRHGLNEWHSEEKKPPYTKIRL